jgi:hypothetical protein
VEASLVVPAIGDDDEVDGRQQDLRALRHLIDIGDERDEESA